MDLEELWQRALKRTEIIRSRILELSTTETTVCPYVFLAESSVNAGDTVVRRGHVLVERPSLILPTPTFNGFAFDQEWHLSEQAIINFLLIRGIRFPSLRYRHELSSLDLREGSLQQTVDHFSEKLQQAEDTQTGLVVGPEDAWQFSVLVLIASLVSRASQQDVARLLEMWRRRQRGAS